MNLITEELTPLFVDRFFAAAQKGDCAEVRMLIDAGMNPNGFHPIGARTALIEAARKDHSALVSTLLMLGAQPDVCDLHAKATATHFAAELLHHESLSILLSAGANINARCKRDKHVLHYLAQRNIPAGRLIDLVKTIDLVLGESPQCDFLDADDTAPLHYCVLTPNVVVLQRLLQAGANPNVQTSQHGTTPLHIAMMEKQFGCADLLYAYGADGGITNKDGKTPAQLITGKHKRYMPPSASDPQSRNALLHKILPHEAQSA